MIVFAFLESSGMSKVLIHHSDGSSLTTTLINRFFTWNIGMAFSTVEPGSFQGISRICQKKAWNRYIFIRKQFLALHKIIIHFSSKLLTSIHIWFLWFEQFHMISRHTVAIFSLKITKNREMWHSRISSFIWRGNMKSPSHSIHVNFEHSPSLVFFLSYNFCLESLHGFSMIRSAKVIRKDTSWQNDKSGF